MRSHSRTMPPQTGTAPPESPLPAPRGVTGIRSRLASFMIAAISLGRAAGGPRHSGMWA